jgi:hypothetical protein
MTGQSDNIRRSSIKIEKVSASLFKSAVMHQIVSESQRNQHSLGLPWNVLPRGPARPSGILLQAGLWCYYLISTPSRNRTSTVRRLMIAKQRRLIWQLSNCTWAATLGIYGLTSSGTVSYNYPHRQPVAYDRFWRRLWLFQLGIRTS